MISDNAKRHAEMLFGMTAFGWGNPESISITLQALIQELDGNHVPVNRLIEMSQADMAVMLFALLVKSS